MSNITIDEALENNFNAFKESETIFIYSDKEGKTLRDFLKTIDANYSADDLGGNPIAPEMWRFTNHKFQ